MVWPLLGRSDDVAPMIIKISTQPSHADHMKEKIIKIPCSASQASKPTKRRRKEARLSIRVP